MGLSLEQKAHKGLILGPETKPLYDNYKEPLTEVKNGYGFNGALATEKTKTHVQCHMCGYFFKHLGIHIAKFHKVEPKAYKQQYGLAAQTSLVAEKTRSNAIEASENVSWWVKRKRLKALANGRKIRAAIGNRYKAKPLELKNKEGRCPDQLIDKIHKLATELGRTPSSREFREYYGGYLGSTYLAFGSWANALKIAKLMPAKVGLPTTYTQQALIQILHDFKAKHDREPSFSDMRNDFMPSQSTFHKYFGSWSKAKKAAFN